MAAVSPRFRPERIVICGAGLHGSALAYYLTKKGHTDVTVVEQVGVGAAASGKGGGFLARDWGSGPTAPLHRVSFALHEDLARELKVESYRRLPVLEVSPGEGKTEACPWLDGEVASADVMDADGGAQVLWRPPTPTP
jgi:glycine/D-amino acid oxidase-like deaminating enzyme